MMLSPSLSSPDRHSLLSTEFTVHSPITLFLFFHITKTHVLTQSIIHEHRPAHFFFFYNLINTPSE